MDKKVTYILIAVVAVVIIAGVAVAVISGNNNNNGGSSEEKITVTYHGNGGTCSTGETYVYESYTIPYITWTRAGYEAIGYTISQDGTGTVYKYGNTVPDTKDLYVKWEDANKITVTIVNLPAGLKVTDKNGNTISSGSVVVGDAGVFKINVENESTPATYTFEKSGSGISSLYLVKSGDTNLYTVNWDGEMYSTGGGHTIGTSEDHTVLTYRMNNYKSLTLTFAPVE